MEKFIKRQRFQRDLQLALVRTDAKAGAHLHEVPLESHPLSRHLAEVAMIQIPCSPQAQQAAGKSICDDLAVLVAVTFPPQKLRVGGWDPAVPSS
jgi:hypothetical protein